MTSLRSLRRRQLPAPAALRRQGPATVTLKLRSHDVVLRGLHNAGG